MEKPQGNALDVFEQFHQIGRGLVKLPVAGEKSAVFVAVGIAQHNVLLTTRVTHQFGNAGQLVKRLHDRGSATQVFNRFKKRHHNQACLAILGQGAVKQPGFFLNHQHFKQITHAFSVADNCMSNGFLAKALSDQACRFKNSQLTFGKIGILSMLVAQAACITQQGQQELDLFRFFKFFVARFQPRPA